MHTRNKTDLADVVASPTTPATAGYKTTGLDEDADTQRDNVRKQLLTDDNSSSDDDPDETPTDSFAQLDPRKSDKGGGVLVSLIMDMCRPLFGSGRVVNMDNYYTSPTIAWLLSEQKLYMRGTCRTNRLGFPSGISFTSKEKNNWGRGSIRGMVEKRKRIAAFGWLDGNPVHFLTTADGNAVSTVTRRVGRERKTIEAPVSIKNYNAYMQAVDRHDQLRAVFSLSARHGFKKYYHKIGLGLIDMAIVNAWIHYKLVHPDKCSNELSRYEFMDALADSLLETNWQEYTETSVSGDNEDILRQLVQDKRSNNTQQFDTEMYVVDDNASRSNRCTPVAVQQLMSGKRSLKKGLSCQVCMFEGRGGNITRNVVVCSQHCIRACNVSREDRTVIRIDGKEVQDYSWRAPMPGSSCWEKMHNFYIPNGLFRDEVGPLSQGLFRDEANDSSPQTKKFTFQCCRISSTLYKRKKDALGQPVHTRGRRGGSGGDVDCDDDSKDNDMVAL